ncbi:SSU ribosomal protein S6P modification protein [Pelagirhabdus alkalitolerans]|uniref:SSU ribosomal protein S6P modification protein n=1 Tax=Pelagirhabdus alkalitolerans TaxID=1612202 RepID=A0A1G6KZY7_9BACI|nr:RimK family alpha-L-glutamate ligase [Pelagirhabdus alkalitolerans]SDC36514.1 SSU ribosomal protein S6P modification protein [Pelagirhabdus alkalitolerans]
MDAWLIYNSSLKSKKFSDIHKWYVKTAKEMGITLHLVANSTLNIGVVNNQLSLKHSYPEPAFVLFLDKDIHLAYQLEALGFRLYNNAQAIELCDDKVLMHQAIARKGLKQPDTRFAPKFFHNDVDVDDYRLIELEKTLGYPMIVKNSFGSFGQQVYLVKNHAELKTRVKQLLDKPHLYQRYLPSSRGVDIRLQVVGEEVITSVKRFNPHDFRANVTNGGKMEGVDVSDDYKALAIQASLAVGADFSGVDLLIGEGGEPLVCEVNSNAHIKNIYECTGVDVSIDIFRYILENNKKEATS